MSSPILQMTARLLTPIIILFSLYLLWRGHDAPGGGFIAALAGGAAIMLQYLAYGPDAARRFLPIHPTTLLGSGLLLAVGYGVAGLLAGGRFLEGAVWKAQVPVIGEVKLVASLAFDVGVYLVVVAVVSSIVRYFGEEAEAAQ